MPFGRLKHLWNPWDGLFRTLRFRLTFWNSATILVLVVATLFGLREGLRYTLLREFDAILAEDIDEVRKVLERYHGDWKQIGVVLEEKAESHQDREWFVRILSGEGDVLHASTKSPDVFFPISANKTAPLNQAGYRILQQRVHQDGQPDYLVRMGASTKSVDEDILQLSEEILVAGLLILIIAPLTGYWLAGRATRPLAIILETTARLRPDRLNERLPLHDTGDELDKLSSTINGLLDRIAEHVQNQREFVSNAAHELRSPLAALRTSFEVALDRDRSADEYRELLADLMEECDGLGKLVNQLLLLAEGDAGLAAAGIPVQLDNIVRRSLEMFQGLAEQNEVRLQAGTLATTAVWGNDYHLRQVIHNLLDNALKYTPAGGTVKLSVSVDVDAQTGRKLALLLVHDTGPGIAPEDLPRLGERFYRADKSRQRLQPISGSGLGLSICKAIVHSYGGQLAIESTLGHGTTVTVALPLAGAEAVPCK